MPVEITSRQNSLVRACRALARGRDGDRVLLDGAHLVEDAAAAGISLETVIAGHTFARAHSRLLEALPRDTLLYLAPDDVLEAASPVKQPSGIVAIATLPSRPVADALRGAAMAAGLVGVGDPGNAGAVVRAVEAAGGTGVIAADGTADLRGWKALRAAMGSAFRVPLAATDSRDLLRQAQTSDVRVIASTLDGETDMREWDWTAPFLLLIGSEGEGLPADIAATADVRVRIPMAGRVQSLNAAVSAAVMLFEAQRQRAAAPAAGARRHG